MKVKKATKLGLFSLVLAVLLTTTNVTALSFSKDIIPSNNLVETNKKHYPVINLQNTTNLDIEVNYDYYIVQENDKYIQDVGVILVPAKSNVDLELPKLKILGSTNEKRRIWFTWNIDSSIKPKQSQIDTLRFRASEEHPEEELGCK